MPESLLVKLLASVKKENLAQVRSCESCEISKNTFFTEHLRWLFTKLKAFYQIFHKLLPLPIKCQCCPYVETSQLICCANELTGFYMRVTLALKGFTETLNFNWLLFHSFPILRLYYPKNPTLQVLYQNVTLSFHLDPSASYQNFKFVIDSHPLDLSNKNA